MATRIGFLRAVNVGRRTVAMSQLKAVCESLGYADVQTYVNSGNVVFGATGSRGAIEQQLERALEDEFGFECTTFVRTPAELRAALALHPFEVAAGDTYFVTFLKAAPSAPVAKALEAASNDFDTARRPRPRRALADARQVHRHEAEGGRVEAARRAREHQPQRQHADQAGGQAGLNGRGGGRR